MTDVDRAFADLVAADPMPSGAAEHPEAFTATALLEIIDARIHEVRSEPIIVTPVSQPSSRRRTGLLVAAAVFLVIVLSVGAVALFATSGGEDDVVDITSTTTPVTTTSAPTTTLPSTSVPPTTTTVPPTTTTEAREVDAADRVVIDSFVETFNAGDWEATLSSLPADAEVWSDLIAGSFTSEAALPLDEFGDLIGRWFRFSAVQQSRISLDSCEPLDDGRITCRGTFSDVIVDRSPLGPAGLSMTFMVNADGQVSYLFVRPNEPSMNAAYGYFFFWLDEVYPGDSDILSDQTGRMALGDDALDLLPIRVAEWIETLDQ